MEFAAVRLFVHIDKHINAFPISLHLVYYYYIQRGQIETVASRRTEVVARFLACNLKMKTMTNL